MYGALAGRQRVARMVWLGECSGVRSALLLLEFCVVQSARILWIVRRALLELVQLFLRVVGKSGPSFEFGERTTKFRDFGNTRTSLPLEKSHQIRSAVCRRRYFVDTLGVYSTTYKQRFLARPRIVIIH